MFSHICDSGDLIHEVCFQFKLCRVVLIVVLIFDNHEIDCPNYWKMVKLFKLNNDKITIFHLEVQTAREAGDRGFQMSLNRLYNAMGWRWH